MSIYFSSLLWQEAEQHLELYKPRLLQVNVPPPPEFLLGKLLFRLSPPSPGIIPRTEPAQAGQEAAGSPGRRSTVHHLWQRGPGSRQPFATCHSFSPHQKNQQHSSLPPPLFFFFPLQILPSDSTKKCHFNIDPAASGME